MPHAYVTYFDKNYAVKGIAMIRSLFRHDPGSVMRVVCLDDETFTLVAKVEAKGGRIIPVRLKNIEQNDKDLAKAKGNRSTVEYYWTLTPTIMVRFLQSLAPDEVLTYVDADLLFFSSTEIVYQELGDNSVLIHGHNFPPQYAHFAVNGLYNVGLVCIRNDADGIKVAEWWRARCNEWCYDRREDGKMGDQKYLESFSTISDKVAIANNPGIGVGPWNYLGYKLSEIEGVPCVNGVPTVFYHYHSAAIPAPGVLAPCTDLSYPVTWQLLRLFALPYLKVLDETFAQIQKLQPGFKYGFKSAGLTEAMCIIAKEDMEGILRENYPCILPLADNYIVCASDQFPDGLRECGPVIRAGGLSWTGAYKDWASAQKAAGGYDDQAIFKQVRDAARMVRDGKATWERDSALFAKEEWNWPLLAALFKVAALNKGQLHVLDFGGAFGSTYMQNRAAFSGLSEIGWHVVEQEHFVKAGQEEFASRELQFHHNMEEVLDNFPVNVILLSGVLQYLPQPYALLKKLAATGKPIIIDRTPLLENEQRLTVQHVPASIYRASYPCWWLNKKRITNILENAGYLLSPWFQSSVDPENFLGVFAQPVKKSASHSLEANGGKIRLMQVDDFYPGYLDAFYAANPKVGAQSSREQAEILLKDGFSAIHAIAPYLSKDKYEVDYFVTQAQPMQRAWARENGVQFPENSWEMEMVRRRIEIFQPDVLYLADPARYDGKFLSSLRFKPRLVLGWKAADLAWNVDLRGYDIILSGLPKLLEFARTRGASRGVMFKPGMPGWLAEAVADTPKTVDVCFVGSVSPSQHVSRLAMLESLAASARQDGFSLALHLNCDAALLPDSLNPYIQPPVFGLAMQRTLAASRIVVDDRASHGVVMPNGTKKIDLGGEDTINMRLFEATGSGSLLITRNMAGVEKYFKPGKELDTWNDYEELERKILYWLSHDEERQEMTRAGKARCLTEHGMDEAVKEFGGIIVDALKK